VWREEVRGNWRSWIGHRKKVAKAAHDGVGWKKEPFALLENAEWGRGPSPELERDGDGYSSIQTCSASEGECHVRSKEEKGLVGFGAAYLEHQRGSTLRNKKRRDAAVFM